MTVPHGGAAGIFRDEGNHNPRKEQIRDWGNFIEEALKALETTAAQVLPVYDTIAAGEAAVAEGAEFRVNGSGDLAFSVYRIVSGVAALQYELPTVSALSTIASVADIDAIVAKIDHVNLSAMGQTIYQMSGVGDAELKDIPATVDRNNLVLDRRSTGNAATSGAELIAMGATLHKMTGRGDRAVSQVDPDNYVLQATAFDPDMPAVYVHQGTLRVIGNDGPDQLLSDRHAYIAAQVVGGAVRAVYDDGAGPVVVRVALDGSVYPERTSLRINGGQSNGADQGETGTGEVHFDGLQYAHRPLMPATASANVWLRPEPTSQGASIPVDAITGLTDLKDTITPSTKHGSSAVGSAARAHTARVDQATSGWTPKIIVANVGEGGQFIANMLDGADPGYYYAANITAILQGVAAQLPGEPVALTWHNIQQGENEPADAGLGAKHEQLRAETQVKAQSIFGQLEPVRMLSRQPSSFRTGNAGALSILDQALADVEGCFFCLGPTYIYPWAAEFLHHLSLGHVWIGQMEDWAMNEVEQGRGWTPPHIVSASVTGTNEITAVLSEACVIDAQWLVADIVSAGVTLAGGDIAGLSVSGTTMTITTAAAASAVTSIGIALDGHDAGARTAATIPRSTIRSVASGGKFLDGPVMHKPIAHQQFNM